MQDFAQPSVPRHRATYADVLAAPEHLVAEVFDGTLYTMPRPRPRHASASSRLGVALGGPFDMDPAGPGGWRILDEPELHLGEDIAVPDLAGWRRERMARLPETAWFGLAPDWVCEVLSNSTRALDLTTKRAFYAQHGVSHLWLLDPEAQSLEVQDLRNGAWTVIARLLGDAVVAEPPFAAAPFRLNVLWDA